ncbi:MAG: OB-fold nucleic acid binding domain-containing protein, partial [Candidatus Omnitrophota bacterium]
MDKSDYGHRFLPKDSLAEIQANFREGRKVRVAGRLMTRRDMGKSAFADLRDEGARMQVYAKKDILGEENYKSFTGLSLGDIIGLEGELFNSKTGEPTIKIEKFERLSRIVRTLPEKWHGL